MDKAAVDAAVSALESSIHTIDFWALVCGIGVAIFLAGEIWFIGAHWLKESAVRPLRERQTELTELEIAKANARAAEASLELAKFKAPRVLQPEQWAAITAVMRPFGNIQFDVAVGPMGDPEPEVFGRILADSLSNAGWTQMDWNTNDPQVRLERPGSRFVGLAAVTNVIVDIHPAEAGRLWPAAQALAGALKAQGIDADAQQGSGGRNSNAAAIHVMIGRKM